MAFTTTTPRSAVHTDDRFCNVACGRCDREMTKRALQIADREARIARQTIARIMSERPVSR